MKDSKNIDTKLFELIESYLEDKLDADEKVAFEVKMKAERELQQEVDLQRILRGSVEVGAMKEQLDEIHLQYFEEASEKRTGTSLWRIAAGIALILGIGAMWYNMESESDILFAEYATIDAGMPVSMGVTDSYDFYDGMIDYKQADYKSALSKWTKLLAVDAENDTLRYYIAASHFAKEEFSQAIPIYEQLLVEQSSIYSDPAQWYLCLSYLKTGMEAKLLAMDPIDGSRYYDRIQEIKKHMNE